jgi:hypothetical protein
MNRQQKQKSYLLRKSLNQKIFTNYQNREIIYKSETIVNFSIRNSGNIFIKKKFKHQMQQIISTIKKGENKKEKKSVLKNIAF